MSCVETEDCYLFTLFTFVRLHHLSHGLYVLNPLGSIGSSYKPCDLIISYVCIGLCLSSNFLCQFLSLFITRYLTVRWYPLYSIDLALKSATSALFFLFSKETSDFAFHLWRKLCFFFSVNNNSARIFQGLSLYHCTQISWEFSSCRWPVYLLHMLLGMLLLEHSTVCMLAFLSGFDFTLVFILLYSILKNSIAIFTQICTYVCNFIISWQLSSWKF